MTRALAGLKDEANIRVNCVCPGVVNTPLVTSSLRNLTGAALEQAQKTMAAMPMIPPEDIAQGVVELIEDDDAVGYAMGITLDQPHRIVPPPINLPISSGDASALRPR
jgi:NAD(P)-dependent dehydrogenase (short-subunit alcohol dehydrogenase family)